MIEYSSFVFASPPRTGSTWFIHAAAKAGLGEKPRFESHKQPPKDYTGLKVSLVRNPYDWLVSYYLTFFGGCIGVEEVDVFANRARESDHVEDFIARYLLYNSGDVGKMFASYNPSSVLRLEDFPWAPIEFFGCLDTHPEKLSEISKMSHINSRKGDPHKRSDLLYKRVMYAESEFCELYDYC